MILEQTEVGSILTRTSGFLEGISSHSLQPYRGCPFGSTLCGVGCYVQHARHLLKGRSWGAFLEVRTNAADVYRATVNRERKWARHTSGTFGVYLSSSTEPFPPVEQRFGITRAILEAMEVEPPDLLIVQTHSHRVQKVEQQLISLSKHSDVRVHLSIETDRTTIPGLPGHASSIERRFEVASAFHRAGLYVVVTVAPLLPIDSPEQFFARIAQSASAVVIDHFIGGDGSRKGGRTFGTRLPEAMARINPSSTELNYRDQMAEIAERHLPGRVGVGRDGFAGRWMGPSS